MKKGDLGVVQGGKKPDLIMVKIVKSVQSQAGMLTFVGACDLNTFEDVKAAFEEQGYLDLVSHEGDNMRVYRGENTLAVVHMATIAQAPKGLIVPNKTGLI